VHTVSRKSERLVNLTIALLATRRYLTKNEIFRTIEGYEGNDESKERMFERDKDDLRSLGIEIEVGGFDPIFNDEAGYRIKPENYALDLGEISGSDIALLSLAASAWNGQALNAIAHSALLKLKSIGIDSDIDSIPTLAPRMASASSELVNVVEAITTKSAITFEYMAQDLSEQKRTIHPNALASRDGHWYFAGLDVDKNAIRTFRLDRVQGEIALGKKMGAFVIPTDFDLFSHLDEAVSQKIATVDVRKDKAFALRKQALSIIDKGEWDQITIKYSDQTTFLDSLLWHLDDVLVIEPAELRDSIIDVLRTMVVVHGKK
jgi:proteasome accessory factor B